MEGSLVAVFMTKVRVVFIPPVMIHMPLPWTVASLLVSLLLAVAHAAALYSVTGLTLPVRQLQWSTSGDISRQGQ